MAEPVIEIKDLKNFLGSNWVHDGLDLTVNRGEIIAVAGGSGCGKTTVVRSILMLHRPTSGSIHVFGTDVLRCSAKEAKAIRHRWGMLFQQSALFSSMTVLENVMFPLREFTHLELPFIAELAKLKISLVGLPIDAGSKYPAELSGGMLRRAAAARALALDPELLFLDEPTSGLDPKSAQDFDSLILKLRDSLGLTIVIISHDIDTLSRVADKVAFIGEGKVLALMPFDALIKQPHPLIKDYFSGRVVQKEGAN